VKASIVKDKPRCISFLIAATTIAFFLIMMIPNYSALAYTEHGDGDGSSSSPSSTMYFRVLKGDLNVCSPNYQHNVTICQTVMKSEELVPYAGETSNSTHSNNSTNSTNPTNSSSYPPLSEDPEMVISEEQLQTLLTNGSSNSSGGTENTNQNGTSTVPSNSTQLNDIGKIYVDQSTQYEPLVVEQPLEDEIIVLEQPLEDEMSISDSAQRPWQSNPQPFFMNNQTVSNGAHDIEEPMLQENPIRQHDSRQDSVPTNEDLRLSDKRAENLKADTSNSYSSIPIGMALPVGS
jgi:hypothetical protein